MFCAGVPIPLGENGMRRKGSRGKLFQFNTSTKDKIRKQRALPCVHRTTQMLDQVNKCLICFFISPKDKIPLHSLHHRQTAPRKKKNLLFAIQLQTTSILQQNHTRYLTERGIADVEFEDIGAHNEPEEEHEHGGDDEHGGEDLANEADDAVEDAPTTAAQAPVSTSVAGWTTVGLGQQNGGTVVSVV
ncbi:uncharacterized protein HKW66_Vig0169950 [Vigna angularis]|uniref:Uncharacterized protein n=1 Tax=Phaseolus angularis TaxID=3914 RepID=A0A8T0JSN3_PHAAN|nr:uncharacterized protein HKW66_Vig0169950 [Vigna angularis]